MSDRCSGHCCKAFLLPYSYNELRRAWASSLRAKYHPKDATRDESWPGWWHDDKGDRHGLTADIETIFPNLIPLGFGPHPHGEVDTGGRPQHWYRCKALKDNGDCGIYATRPGMCSEYPYGDRCKYKSCTWDRARSDNPPTRRELIQIRRPMPAGDKVEATKWDPTLAPPTVSERRAELGIDHPTRTVVR